VAHAAEHLPDVGHAFVLDNVVKATNDVCIEWKGKILLGRRKVYPQRNWWYGCGGRMMPGESRVETTRRLLRRELAVELPVDCGHRVSTIGHYSFVWQMREQPPKNHGTADISVVVLVHLTDAEVARIKLNPNEYEASAWVAPKDIIDGAYHPGLKRGINDFLRLRMYADLEQLALHGVRTSSDAVTHGDGGASAARDDVKSKSDTGTTSSPLTVASGGTAVSDREVADACRAYLRFAQAIAANDHLVVHAEESAALPQPADAGCCLRW